MTPDPDKAGRETDEPEKESEPVPTDTDTETGAAADETDRVESDTAATEHAESTDASSGGSEDGQSGARTKTRRRISLPRLFAFVVLPCLVLLLAAGGGYLKWQSASMRASQSSGIESAAAAKDATVAMLSYQPDTVEKDLGAARDRLTGTFRDSYTQLTHDVVIPGAKQRHISAVATVPAVASVSASANHAVALVFVNQTVVVGNDPPTATASSIRVTLDKIGDRWLIIGFDPV